MGFDTNYCTIPMPYIHLGNNVPRFFREQDQYYTMPYALHLGNNGPRFYREQDQEPHTVPHSAVLLHSKKYSVVK